MKKLISISMLLATCAWSLHVNAQGMAWADQIGGTLAEKANDVTTDANGNVYVTGEFGGTTDFDPGVGVFNLTSSGTGDAFVAKLNAAGSLLWAVQFGENQFDAGSGIAVGASGNVYITGTFGGTVDFDPGTGVTNLTSAATPSGCPNPVSRDIFIIKLDANGNLIWAKNVGGNGQDVTRAIALGTDESVHISGEYVAEGSSVDLDPGIGTYYLSASPGTSAFVLKLTVDGNFVWAKQFPSTMVFASGCGLRQGGNYFYTLKVDGTNAVIVGGTFSSSTDFDPSTSVYTLAPIACNGCKEGVVFKLSATGVFRWASQFGGGHCEVNNIALDANGRVHATGPFIGTVDFNPSATTNSLATYSANKADAFVVKLNGSGAYVWAKKLGGNGVDVGKAIGVDASGNVYSTGTFESTADFNPASGKYNLVAAGSSDVYVSKLSASGAYVWARGFGGTLADVSEAIWVNGTDIYTTGYFAGTVDFNPLTGIYNLTAVGGNDGFVHKIDQNITAKTDETFSENEVASSIINLYPNPTDGLATLVLRDETASTIRIYNVSGLLLSSQKTSGEKTIELDLSYYATGVYFVEVTTATRSERIKLLKTE